MKTHYLLQGVPVHVLVMATWDVAQARYLPATDIQRLIRNWEASLEQAEGPERDVIRVTLEYLREMAEIAELRDETVRELSEDASDDAS